MTTWWIYKCNSQNREYQRDSGDWDVFFTRGPVLDWGTSELIPALAQLHKGDMIIAYQTDRNELVGLAKVERTCEGDTYLYLRALDRIDPPVKVRPLKKANPKIAAIPALQGGPIKTIYTISYPDAARLLRAAGFHYTTYGSPA